MGPRVFSHCIVRVEVNGAVYWLDPTMPPQTGSLAYVTQAHDSWGLPLAKGGDLEEIAAPPMLTVREIEEVWTFPRNIKLASRLECRTTIRAWQADQTRAVFEGQGEKAVADKYREALSRELRSTLRDIEPLRREDDRVTNTHTIVETYEVDRALEPVGGNSARFQSADDIVSSNLPLIPAGERRQPIGFGTPRIVKISRTFKFAAATNFSPWNQLETGPGGLEGRNAFHWVNDREGRHEITVTIPVAFLPRAQAAAYRDFAERMHRNNGVGFAIETSGDTQTSSSSANVWWMVLGGILLLSAVARCASGAG